MVDRSFSWLGIYPLALDLTNTIIANRDPPVDLLASEGDLEAWISVLRDRHAGIETARGHLPVVRQLRETVRSVLYAKAARHPLPARGADNLGKISSRAPRYLALDDKGVAVTLDLCPDPFAAFTGAVARSAIELAGDQSHPLRVCDAPSCGMLYVIGNPRQKWCSTACGNRARVARHARKAASSPTAN